MDVALEDRECRRLTPFDVVLEARRERGLDEPALLQEPANLEIRVDPLVEAAEELQHEPLAISDGRIVLVGAQPARLGRRFLRTAEVSVVARRRRDDLAEFPPHAAPPVENVEKQPIEVRIGHGVAQEPLDAPGLPFDGELRDDALGRPFLRIARSVPGHESERKRVSLRLSVFVLDFDDTDARVRVLVERDGLEDARCFRLLGLAREPPGVHEVKREDRLELVLLRSPNERFEIALGGELGKKVRGSDREARPGGPLEGEPIEDVRAERQHVRPVADRRERRSAEQLDRDHPLVLRQVDLDVLHVAREVRDDENSLLLVASHERDRARVVGIQKLDRAAPESAKLLPQGDETPHPPEERVAVRLVRFDVDCLVVVLVVDDDGEYEPLRIGARKSRVAVAAPLHRRAHAVAVAEVDVVPHADLVAVIEDGRAG
jgi:hypothetical protein